MAAGLTVASLHVIGQSVYALPGTALADGSLLRALEQIRAEIVMFGVAAAVLFSAVGWIVAFRIASPLRILADAAQRIENGELGTAVPQIQGRSEFAVLARAVGLLVSLQVSHDRALKALADSHERALAER